MTKFETLKEIGSHLILVKKSWKSIGILMLVYVGLLSSSPYFYKVLIESLETNTGGTNLILTICLWVFIISATVGARYVYGMKLLELTQRDWFNFLMKSMKTMLRLPIDYHISLQHGEKQKILDRASEAVWDMGDKLLLWIIPRFLVAIILIISGLYISIEMTLISLALLPVAFFIIHSIGNKAHTHQKEANKYWDMLFNRITDSFGNLKIIRIFAREKEETMILHEKFSKARDVQYKIRKLWILFHGIDGLIVSLSQIITLSGGIFLMLQGKISLGTLFFFISFTEKIYGPIFEIFRGAQEMLIHVAGYEKMQKLYAMKPEIDSGKNILPGVSRTITFENISFSYPSSDREVLTDISFEIKKGQRIALIGHTGSGKSTIIQLLMRFYEPSSGKVLIDGKDIYDFTLESYRQKFAAVFQDTTLFNETIRHNLEYVRDGITDEILKKACKEANILDFIESLPNKWETEVGERGLKLSGGEKQRIAIARAILADPEILILDEATSALDTKTERTVQEAFDHLMNGRTSIIIAHRLSTIQSADVIYLMEKGRIVAKGNHKELYSSSKEYQEMVDMQHDGFVGEEVEKIIL